MPDSKQAVLRIRSSGPRWLAMAVVCGLTAMWAVVFALTANVFQKPPLFWYWAGSIALLLILGLLFEASFRLDTVSVREGLVCWRLRRGQRGERPINEVRNVERTETGSARILFTDGESIVIGAGWFRRGDIDRLIAAISSPGQKFE